MSRTEPSLHLNEDEINVLLELFPKGLVALDLETTGLSPLLDKVIEIAAVRIDINKNISIFHQMINPLIEIPAFTTDIHGITNQDVKEMPGLKKPLKELFTFMNGMDLLAHSAQFDTGFLVKGAHDFQLTINDQRVFDSCKFSRAIYKGTENAPENFKLPTLVKYFGFEYNSHMALDDTFACIKVMAQGALKSPGTDWTKKALEKSFTFNLNQFSANTTTNFPSNMNPLIPLVRERTPLEIQYSGGSDPLEWRDVIPLTFLPMPKGPVLMAKCLISGHHKFFILKRIKNYKVKENYQAKHFESIEPTEIEASL